MRIVIAVSTPVFEANEQLAVARELAGACRRLGHGAVVVTLPRPRLGAEFAAYLAAWLTDLRRDGGGREVDRLISLAYPAFAVRHPLHVAWLGARNEKYYDEWPQALAGLPAGRRLNARFHRYIMANFDNYFLQRNVERVFAQTADIARRLERQHQLDKVAVLAVPPPGAPAWEETAAELLRVKPSTW